MGPWTYEKCGDGKKENVALMIFEGVSASISNRFTFFVTDACEASI